MSINDATPETEWDLISYLPMQNYKKPLTVRPPIMRHGDKIFNIPKQMVEKRDEIAVAMQFVAHRRLFGFGYRELHRGYFESMPLTSGVVITGLVPIEKIISGVTFPGDIDLLVIPFEGDDLVLSEMMAIEVKVLRATFRKQGKSPNDFGFSQAQALKNLGFPFVSVIHFIVSDVSPREAWRGAAMGQVIDAANDRISEPEYVDTDMMPSDLIERSYGRLIANSPDPEIGLLAQHMTKLGATDFWVPRGRPASSNIAMSIEVMDSVADYYSNNPLAFVETLRYPPGTASVKSDPGTVYKEEEVEILGRLVWLGSKDSKPGTD